MPVVEFKTILHNGKVTLPSEYAEQWEGKTIRVLILEDVEPVTEMVKPSENKPFQSIALKTQGFKLNREEANVRRSFS